MGRHGNGTVYELENGRHRAEITIGGKKFTKTGDKRLVTQWLKEMSARGHQGMPVTADKQTLGQYLHEWMASSVTPRLKAKTCESYELNLRRVTPHIGHIRLRDLTPTHVDQCYAALRKQGLSESSVGQAHALLNKALKDTVKKRRIPLNPADAVDKPRPIHREMEPFSAEQVQQLFACTEGERLHALWILLATTGLRLGEALGLTWDDIDWESRRVYVRRALQRLNGGKGLQFASVKSHRSRRPIPLYDETVQALRRHRLLQQEERLTAGCPESDGLVFTTKSGKPLDPTNTWTAFARTLKRHGLPQRRLHDMRHTFATQHVTSNTHMKVVQELLGHSSYNLTANTYAHVAPVLHEEAAQKMAAFFPERDLAGAP